MAHPLTIEEHDRVEAFIQTIPEIIIAAAIKKIGTDMIVMHERPSRHSASLNAVPHRYEDGKNAWECGFITSRGRFVDREEAGRIVRDTGQGTTTNLGNNNLRGLLFSEDLWLDDIDREMIEKYPNTRGV